MKTLLTFLFIFITFTSVHVPTVSAAEGLTGLIPCASGKGPSGQTSGLNCDSWEDLVEVIQFLINFAFILATLLATVSFSFAGWLYLTSNGDTGKVQRAHKIFIKVVQGFLVIAVAYLLVKTILTGIAKQAYNLLE